MINWQYNPNEYKPEGFELIPPGQYRVRIEKAEEQTSKKGYPMIKMILKVNGYNTKLWHFMVFMNTDPEMIRMTNNNLGRIFDSFDIPTGDLNLQDWQGKVGAANIKNELDDKNEMRAKISYFIPRNKQNDLPAWSEHRGNVNEDDIPF